MDSNPAFDNPQTLPIRRGQPVSSVVEEDESLMPDDLMTPDEAPATLEPEPELDLTICPRCHGKLVNPQELGWCPKCGYCRSLEKDKATARLVKEAPPTHSAFNRFGEMGEMIGKIPGWGWTTAAGACAIVALACVTNHYLPPVDSLARALIGLIGVVATLVVFLCLNLWSLFLLGANDENIGPKHVIFCAPIWRKICLRLPETRYPFCTGIWTLTVFFSALLIVGGFDYWWELYKPKRVAKTELLTAVTALSKAADENKSLTEAVEDFAKKQDLANKLDPKKKVEDSAKITTQCVIVGYTLDGENKLSGLVVGALLSDRVRYAGIVKKGWDERQEAEMLTALEPLIQPKSYIPGLNIKAIWVKPEVFCEVEHQDFDKEQHFIASQFKSILTGK
jgi:hypothetical protein